MKKYFSPSALYLLAKDFIIGRKLSLERDLNSQKLRKLSALAVFSSDALSSTAYATEAILLVLAVAGAAAALAVAFPIAVAISILIGIVGFSYFQTVHAYPNGGGAYVVSKENLGEKLGLIAASALLVDYVLTVSVSISAGVSALASAFPEISYARVPIGVLIIVFIAWVNLRGMKESAGLFAIPTYSFIFAIFAMIASGIYRHSTGALVQIPQPAEIATVTAPLTIFLVLRAFAGGCTALTGVEAISNGVPAFRNPESKNAGETLIIMAGILVSMFLGITFLAVKLGAYAYHGVHETVLSQIGRAVFGNTVPFYFLQITTLLILSIAANTAYADFPRLSSLIARDGYLPSFLSYVGRRLVYSKGILLLSISSIAILALFQAQEQRILPLYAVGVFVSFTLSQTGMVVHWIRERGQIGIFRRESAKETAVFLFHIGVNGIGAVATGTVFLVLLATKFMDGAWIVFLAIPALMGIFLLTKRGLFRRAYS